MSHQYKAGDVVTVFQISSSKELVGEGKATIRKRVADIDEQYRVEFANKPGVTCERFFDSWGQDDPEKYVQDFNRRSARQLRGTIDWGNNGPNLWGSGITSLSRIEETFPAPPPCVRRWAHRTSHRWSCVRGR
jgi:hypothetical protein